jgi:hypothetical protein
MGDKLARMRRIRQRHPGWQERQCGVRLTNDEMFNASMVLASYNRDQFTAAWVKRVADQNLKHWTPGSMPLV